MIKNLSPALLVATLFLPMFAGAQVTLCVDLQNNLARRATDLETNNEVTTLQGFLKDSGYFAEDPVGNFGPKTEKAVKKFQTANKIYNSGFVGPITRAKIRKSSGCSAPVVSGSVGTSCTGALKLCASGSYAARIGANCSWAVCPTSSVGGTSAGNTSGNTGNSGNITSGGTTGGSTTGGTGGSTSNTPPVDPGPPPPSCFNRTVTYYEYDTKRGGFFKGGVNANNLSPISQGAQAWRPPSTDMDVPGKMIVIRFKTDDAGYMSNSILAWGHESARPDFGFISPTPCDYTWAYDTAFNPSGTYNDALVTQNSNGFQFRVPVLAENQVEPFFTSVGTYNGFPMNSSFYGTNKLNKKGYLKPNTYYYYHILFADIFKGGTGTIPGAVVPGVTNNAQLAAAPDACGEQQAVYGAGGNCFGATTRLDWMNSFDEKMPPRINAAGQLEMAGNIITGLPAPK